MAESIRDVVIRVAVEQKQVQIVAPSFEGVTKAADLAGEQAAKSIETKMNAGIKAVNEDLKALERQLKENEAAYNRQVQLTQRVAAQQSAVAAAYVETATSAVQLARGLAFVTAASEEEAAQTVKLIATAQGYSDLIVGGIHIYKSLNDIKRQTAVLNTLEAASAAAATTAVGAQSAATAGATATQTAFNASLLANPIVLLIAGLAGATLAIRAWAASEMKAIKDVSEAEGKLAQNRAAFANRLANTAAQSVNLRLGNSDSEDAIVKQMQRVEEARNRLNKAGNVPMAMDTNQNLLIREKAINDLLNQRQELNQQDLAAHDKLLASMEQERQVAGEMVNAAKQRVLAEQETLKTVAQQVGALSRGDVNRLKRIQGKVDAGQQLTRQEAVFAAGQQGLELSGAARRQLQRQGEQSGLRFDRKGLDQAQRDLASTETTAGERIRDIDSKIGGIQKSRDKLLDTMDRALSAMEVSATRLAQLEQIVAKHEADNKKKWFFDWTKE